MNLYEVNEAIMDALTRAVDPDTGEIMDELAAEELNALLMAKDEKVEGILLWIKELTAQAEALKEIKQAYADRQAQKVKKAESLKRYVEKILTPGERFETQHVSVSWRKSESVEYTGGVEALEERFLRMKAPEIDKVALKKALKAGETIAGARLVTAQNMQIK